MNTPLLAPLTSKTIDTPLGPMLAIGHDHSLILLEFERQGLEKKIERLKHWTTSKMTRGICESIDSIEKELSAYFSGTLHAFKTPLWLLGSAFQTRVWGELQKISFGETRSYLTVAKAIGQPTAFRAVAQANAANPLAIVIPCHRVIHENGNLGGYAGGIGRKQTLLDLEQTSSKAT